MREGELALKIQGGVFGGGDYGNISNMLKFLKKIF